MSIKLLKAVDHYLGFAMVHFLRPILFLSRTIQPRQRPIQIENEIVFLKILGGGSILVSYPALLSIRQSRPGIKLTLVCSHQVRVYAELLSIFDEIIPIEMNSLPAFVLSCIRALRRCFGADALVDFEVHSKLTSVFALLTRAKTRVGFYMQWNRWQYHLGTHFIFFNETGPIYEFYQQAASLLGGQAIDLNQTLDKYHAMSISAQRQSLEKFEYLRDCVVVAPFCSDLGKEREFKPNELAEILRSHVKDTRVSKLVLIGGTNDVVSAESYAQIMADLPNVSFENLVGLTSLRDVVAILMLCSHLITIDSGINHLARLLRVRIFSFWGPTSPSTRLRQFPGLHESVRYLSVPCSPCVHLIDSPPCNGDNVCMKRHIRPENGVSKGWVIQT